MDDNRIMHLLNMAETRLRDSITRDLNAESEGRLLAYRYGAMRETIESVLNNVESIQELIAENDIIEDATNGRR